MHRSETTEPVLSGRPIAAILRMPLRLDLAQIHTLGTIEYGGISAVVARCGCMVRYAGWGVRDSLAHLTISSTPRAPLSVMSGECYVRNTEVFLGKRGLLVDQQLCVHQQVCVFHREPFLRANMIS